MSTGADEIDFCPRRILAERVGTDPNSLYSAADAGYRLHGWSICKRVATPEEKAKWNSQGDGRLVYKWLYGAFR